MEPRKGKFITDQYSPLGTGIKNTNLHGSITVKEKKKEFSGYKHVDEEIPCKRMCSNA